jgi:levansucrase
LNGLRRASPYYPELEALSDCSERLKNSLQSIVIFSRHFCKGARVRMTAQGRSERNREIVLNPSASFTLASTWLPEHVAGIEVGTVPAIPLVTGADIHDVLPGFQLWDCWTLDDADGTIVRFDGWTPWVIMCAPRSVHPDLRHDIARLRLMLEQGGVWRDCGYLLPDDLNPGAREWAGSCVYDADTRGLTLFYTAAGRRGVAVQSYEQRLFQVQGQLVFENGLLSVTDWKTPFENVVADGIEYVVVDHNEGCPGFIKGFRDPFHFRDPADGSDYVLFTASLKPSSSDYNGAIGIARSDDSSWSQWELLPPLISADCVNNELERPVLRCVGGLYYVFWSTQRKTFAPGGPAGPNGLYGMVADSLFGPYRPLNGTGLVAPNPAEEPFQTYSWWVDSELHVVGFVDLWNLDGQKPSDNPELVQRHFGGVPAPTFRLVLKGDSAQIAAA